MATIQEQIIDGVTVPELEFLTSIYGGVHTSRYDYLFNTESTHVTYFYSSTQFMYLYATDDPTETYNEYVYRPYPTDYGTNPREYLISRGSSYTYDDKTVYYYNGTFSTSADPPQDLPLLSNINPNYTSNPVDNKYIAWAMIFGRVIPDGYGITYDLIHATGLPTNPTVQVPGEFPSLAYFTPETNYTFTKNSVTITYGAPDYDPFDDFEFDYVGGGLQIGELSGEIIVTVRARPIPYEDGGTSEPGGGDGTYGDDRFGDGIDDESIEIPDYDSTDEYNRSLRGTGFVNIYTPSRTELQSFASYLWSTPSISDVLKRMYSNPFDAVISLHMVPVTVTGSAGNIFIGGQDSGVASTRAGFQYTTVSCGSLNIGEFWAAYLDYSPYTKLYVYLPFCGMHEVDTDEFMGKTMSIRYDVDIVTGDCLASISASDGVMSRVLYQYQGNCSVEIPVSGQNYNAKVSAYMGLIGTAFGIGAGVASGGMSAAAGVGAALAGALNTVNAKGSIQRSGALSGSTAWMSCLKPYIILVQPTQCLPDDQQKFTGYPSFMTAAVGDLSGYTEFEEIHLAGISATDEEKAEIERIMKEGVLL